MLFGLQENFIGIRKQNLKIKFNYPSKMPRISNFKNAVSFPFWYHFHEAIWFLHKYIEEQFLTTKLWSAWSKLQTFNVVKWHSKSVPKCQIEKEQNGLDFRGAYVISHRPLDASRLLRSPSILADSADSYHDCVTSSSETRPRGTQTLGPVSKRWCSKFKIFHALQVSFEQHFRTH